MCGDKRGGKWREVPTWCNNCDCHKLSLHVSGTYMPIFRRRGCIWLYVVFSTSCSSCNPEEPARCLVHCVEVCASSWYLSSPSYKMQGHTYIRFTEGRLGHCHRICLDWLTQTVNNDNKNSWCLSGPECHSSHSYTSKGKTVAELEGRKCFGSRIGLNIITGVYCVWPHFLFFV
jgi:hypothetical protein